ncbi:MAG TPA: hypothetical protein VGA56_14340 [Opitutaceae bacterium]
MSLNRSEDALLSYLRAHPDEERYWRTRVQDLERGGGAREELSKQLEREFKNYAEERATAAPMLRAEFGAGRVSMRNLAEFALFTWTTPRAGMKHAPNMGG